MHLIRVRKLRGVRKYVKHNYKKNLSEKWTEECSVSSRWALTLRSTIVSGPGQGLPDII
jgi:hypothetical protein